MEKYRMLLIKDGKQKYNAIVWSRENGSNIGDCFVRAINEETEIQKGRISLETHSEPMTLDEVRKHVESNIHMLGSDIGRCMGLSLDDKKDKKIYFQDPISMK